jgi:hypothetical protein
MCDARMTKLKTWERKKVRKIKLKWKNKKKEKNSPFEAYVTPAQLNQRPERKKKRLENQIKMKNIKGRKTYLP